jgi:plastocyanin
VTGRAAVARRAALARRAGVVVTVAVLAATCAAPAAGRRHRLHVAPPDLPHSLTADEREWTIRPSENVVAAGAVRFHAYNRGQDSHNFVIVGPSGEVSAASLASGASATITADLSPGTYQLICTLFADTPQSHEARGMHTTITVR